jgi:hypothetical protein
MNLIITISILVMTAVHSAGEFSCLFETSSDIPRRLVIIKGQATYVDHVTKKDVAAAGQTIIFRKTGCSGCFTAATTDSEGNYRILVGDGVYQVLARNPASPDVDLLDKGQKREINTGSENDPNQVKEFDIKLVYRSSN